MASPLGAGCLPQTNIYSTNSGVRPPLVRRPLDFREYKITTLMKVIQDRIGHIERSGKMPQGLSEKSIEQVKEAIKPVEDFLRNSGNTVNVPKDFTSFDFSQVFPDKDPGDLILLDAAFTVVQNVDPSSDPSQGERIKKAV